MMHVLEPASMKVLNHFYNHFKNKITDSTVKLEQKSLLLTVIRSNPNQLSKLITDSALDNTSFSQIELASLVHNGYIRSLDELGKPNEYAITVKGIWCVESQNNEMDVNRLLNYFQELKLSFKVSNKPLQDIEKIILFAMIGMRNFSEADAMDINSGSRREHWSDIFDMCARYLHGIGSISNEQWNTFHPGNEHPISYVMRRAKNLAQKTVHIYQQLGNYKYCLDVDNGDPQKQLSSLYKLIFGKVERRDLIRDIHSFCCDIAYDKSKDVRETFEYINPDWDRILEKALTKFYYEAQ